MKKLVLLIGIIAGFICQPNSLTAQPNGIQVTESTPSGLKIHFETKDFSMTTFNYKGEEMQTFSMAGFVLPAEKGAPNVPCISSFVAVPHGAKASVNVVVMEKETFENVNLAPSLGIVSDLEKANTDYEKDAEIYAVNAFYPLQNVDVSEPFALRGVDVVALSLFPVQFNPITRQLQVCRNIELELSFEGGENFGENRLRSPYWDAIMERNIVNYNVLPKIDYAARMKSWLNEKATGCEYLIIVPNNDDYVAIANQLKNFRMKQGIQTEVIRLDEIGVSSAEELCGWIYDEVWTWDIPPVAICLAADHGTDLSCNIPSYYVSHPEIGQCVSDFYYSCMDYDELPDICVSRLPASTADELSVMVEKQIDYELNPNIELSFYQHPLTACCWQTSSWFQLCAEVVGGYWRKQGKEPVRVNEILDGTPDEVWSSAPYNTPTIVSYFGPDGQGYLPAHPSELGGWTGGSDTQIINAINAGAFMALHRDHGYETGWEMPHFDNGSVSVLDNHGRLPFVMSINCSTGRFDFGSDCLVEALLKHTKDGATAGAIGAIAPTGPSYTFVNDLLTWGVFDMFDSDFMPDVEHYSDHVGDCLPAFGNVAGKYFLARNSWVTHHGKKAITYKMFTSFCDAFLRVHTEVPQEMNVSYQPALYEGVTAFRISAPQNTTIAFCKELEDGDVELVSLVPATGLSQTIELPLFPLGTKIVLTVTGQNYQRFERHLEVVKPETAFLAIENVVPHSGLLSAGESNSFDVTVKNVGGTTSRHGTVFLFEKSDCLNITKELSLFADIEPNETLLIENAFGFMVKDVTSENANLGVTVVAQCDDSYAERAFEIPVCVPALQVSEMVLQTNDGTLGVGETATISVEIQNVGNGRAKDVKVWADMLNDFVVSADTAVIQNIEPQQSATVSLAVEALDSAPNGIVFYAHVNCEAGENGSYANRVPFKAPLGRNRVEDFELGSLDTNYWFCNVWQNFGYWAVTDVEPYEGNYCCASQPLSDDIDINMFSYFVPSGADDSISFYYRLSGHEGNSLNFYVDATLMLSADGTKDWTRVSFFVPAGATCAWIYEKGNAENYAGDYAAIDFVTLPHGENSTFSAGPDFSTCPASFALKDSYAYGVKSVTWFNEIGSGNLYNIYSLHASYAPSDDDIERGYVVLRMRARQYYEDLQVNYPSDTVTITFESPEIAYMPQPDGEMEILLDSTLIGHYSIPPVENAVSYEWFLSPAVAGEIIGHGTEATVKWNRFTFATDAEISVRAYTRCGDYAESLPLPVGVTLCVDENPDMEGLTVYPNPATDAFLVTAHDVEGQQAVLSVYNAVGQCMMMQKATISDRTAQFRFSSEALPSGLYLIVLQTDETIRTGKLIRK